MKIGNIKIGNNHPPFIIAEFSANHMNKINNFIKMIDFAKKAGVSAIKLQTYTADTMTINSKKKDFLISDKQIKKFVMFYERITKVMLKTLTKKADVVISIDERHRLKSIRFN